MNIIRALARSDAPGWAVLIALAFFIGTLLMWADIFTKVFD